MRQTHTKSRRFPTLTLIAVLLVAVSLTTGLTFSQYRSTATAEATAQVASFEVTDKDTLSANIPLGNLVPGDEKPYKFTIANPGDVAVELGLQVTSTGNLPLTFSVKRGSAAAVDLPLDTVVKLNQMAPGAGEVKYILTVTWPKEENDVKYAGQVDAVKLTVTADQID